MTHTIDGRPRARGLGIALPGEPGPLNAITDVGGVEVGVTTLISGDGPLVVGTGPVRTGVTAILPRGRGGVGQPCAAGWYSLNGNGEMTGTTWIEEAGSTGSHFSGDIFLAFSTADVPGLASAFPVGPIGDDEFGTITFIPWGRMDDLYTAVVQSVEEAVLNALIVNDDMVGRDGHRSPGLPHDRLLALLGQET